MKGYIHSFESMAGVDGEGLRFAVFLAGCPLRCAYCHNPDTWSSAGTEMTGQELVSKIARFKTYFGDRGGATFSGGEPLLQSKFLESMIPLLEKEGIGYIIDTSGAVPLTPSVQSVLRHSDEVLLDLKFWDEAAYLRYTGHSMKPVLQTLSFLEELSKPTVFRTVVVPGINDREDILRQYVSYVSRLHCVKRYELLPFHTMGFFKYEKLGIANPLKSTPALSEERLDQLQKYVDFLMKEDG